MPKIIKIHNKIIGNNQPVFIIAEAGVNHNGKLSLALKLVDAAVRAGADAIKFQTFITDKVITKNAEKETYMKTKDKSQYQMIKRLELSFKDFKKIAQYCAKKNIIFLSTPSDEQSADFLEDLGVGAFKIGSGEMTHIPFIEHVAKKGLPMIIATGASYIKEIAEVMQSVKKYGNNKIILLHCTSYYPAPFDQINLRALATIRKRFGVLVGYSDHTLGGAVSIGAVAMGACVIEKHFTLSKKLSGPDHCASLEPEEFKNLVSDIRNLEQALGSDEKRPTKIEHEERELGRRSIVVALPIKKGIKITSSMLAVKRPGYGLAPKYINKIIGHIARKDMPKDTLFALKDII